jgi:ectoine hydroxylase-related dioxygenase (phytanoyl-CoA dioxygenase family)
MAVKTEPTATLSAEQERFFHDHGYLRLERALPDEELEWMRGLYDRIVQPHLSPGSRGRGGDPSGARGDRERGLLVWIHTPERQFPELFRASIFPRAAELAARLLGVRKEEVYTSGRIFFKPAGHGCETPWHQDEAYGNPTVELRSLNLWLALDPATEESGCLRFIPGSHQGEVREHRRLEGDPTGLALTTDDLDRGQAVSCPLPPGGASLHHCRTLHSSGPNLSDGQRRALVVVCEAPPVPRAVPAHRPWQTWNRDSFAAAMQS